MKNDSPAPPGTKNPSGSSMSVDDYVRVLETRAAGKVVPELAASARAAIAFTFREAHGLERVRVELTHDGVTVTRGPHREDVRSMAYVFCTLADWLAFFENGDAKRMGTIDFYGETSWLKVLARLSKSTPAQPVQGSRAGSALGWATSE